MTLWITPSKSSKRLVPTFPIMEGNNGINLNILRLIIALTFQTQRADFLKPQLKLHCSFYAMVTTLWWWGHWRSCVILYVLYYSICPFNNKKGKKKKSWNRPNFLFSELYARVVNLMNGIVNPLASCHTALKFLSLDAVVKYSQLLLPLPF